MAVLHELNYWNIADITKVQLTFFFSPESHFNFRSFTGEQKI